MPPLRLRARWRRQGEACSRFACLSVPPGLVVFLKFESDGNVSTRSGVLLDYFLRRIASSFTRNNLLV